jgi:hypothetical protein
MAEHSEATTRKPRVAAAACEPQGLDARHEARSGEAAAN